MNRLISAAIAVGLAAVVILGASAHAGTAPGDAGPPSYTPLDMHPVDAGWAASAGTVARPMPRVISQGAGPGADSRDVTMPAVQTPSEAIDDNPVTGAIGKAGTGFFIAWDGTLLTAAHVVKECSHMQVLSRFVPRAWASLVAADPARDLAILRSQAVRPPAVLRLAGSPPSFGKLRILGFPESASLTVPVETWGEIQNQKFPPSFGPMANPRGMLWLSAPGVSHGFSGGPIYDPRLGAVVGLVKGEVDGGYLRLVHDLPTAGLAIGPGVEPILALVRRQAPAAAVTLASADGEGDGDSLRRATVHVLCWRQEMPAR